MSFSYFMHIDILTEDCKNVTGGILHLKNDAAEVAEVILTHIENNKKKLGI